MSTPRVEEARQAYLNRPRESIHGLLVWELAEALEQENILLRTAITKHRDEFPDEALNGEKELWKALSIAPAKREDLETNLSKLLTALEEKRREELREIEAHYPAEPRNEVEDDIVGTAKDRMDGSLETIAEIREYLNTGSSCYEVVCIRCGLREERGEKPSIEI